MNDLDVIKYLIEEIEKEKEYNARYEIARENAEKEAEGRHYIWFMPRGFDRQPRQSIIKANAKKIRQLALKLY